MSHSAHKNATRFGVVLILATLAATAMTTAPAEAQVTVYKVEGVVYSPHYQPLQGAVVTIYTMAGAKSGTATTDAAGKYSIPSLDKGTYNLSVQDACCPNYWVPVEVAGTDPVVQQNVVLGAGQGKGPLTLKGIVKDEKTGKPMANVRLEMWNHPMMSQDKMSSPYRESHQTAISAADGSYSFNLEAGSVNINARLEGYDSLHANLHMEASRSLDLPMRPASQSVVTISGTIKGSDGAPIPYAYVHVQPDYECKDGECTAYMARSEPSSSNASGDVNYWYEPAGSQYASTNADQSGKYTVQTMAGRLIVQAGADQHLENRTKVTASNGEKKTVNLVLERMPPDSVRVSGKVVDAETGKPVPFAQVNLENQRWGHWNHTMTKEDGTFSFNTKPGYTIVTISAEQYYWVPCSYDGRDTSGSSIAPGEPYPCADGGQRTRDRAYYSRTFLLEGSEASHDLDARMQPRPAPTAELKGYVVNASNGKAVPGVQVQFHNEFTRDWGMATTDQDGSFRIKVHAGYYTVRAYAEHYFDAAVNVQVKDGESKRVDVEITPGEKRYGGGGCCYTMAADSSKSGIASYETSRPMMDEESAARTGGGSGGAESYKGEAGGLGPYQPMSGEQSGGTSPGAGIGVLIAGLVAVALLRRRAH